MDTYYASVRESPVGANKNHLAIFNAVGSGKKLVVFRLVAVGSPAAAVAGLKVTLAALRFGAVHSGGTASEFAKANPADADLPSQVTGADGKSATLTVPAIEPVAFAVVNVNPEETMAADGGEFYKAPDDPSAAGGAEPVMCLEGSGFVVRQMTLAGAGAVSLVAEIGLV